MPSLPTAVDSNAVAAKAFAARKSLRIFLREACRVAQVPVNGLVEVSVTKGACGAGLIAVPGALYGPPAAAG